MSEKPQSKSARLQELIHRRDKVLAACTRQVRRMPG